VLPLRATQKIQTMFAGLTPPSSRLEDAAGLAMLTTAAASRRLMAASHGYLAAARRQTHRAL
jgi:hypothetical protein